MNRITIDDRILLVQLFDGNLNSVTETIRKFSTLKKLRRKEEAPTRHAVQSIIERFCETGSVADLPRSGRPRRSEEDVDAVRNVTEGAEGKISSRRISLETNIPVSTVRKILKVDLNFHPYRVHRIHKLTARDHDSRKLFCEKMLTSLRSDETMITKILMTDEAHFHLSGAVNMWNARIWASGNPHAVTDIPLHSPKVTVWMGFCQNFLLEPYFFEDESGVTVTVNSDRYCEMIDNHVVPELKTRRAYRSIIFQQDGATPQISNKTRDFLRRHFGERVISLRFETEWPSHSPDLNGCDFWLWGYLKANVYHPQPRTLQELKERIRTAIRSIPMEMLEAVMCNFEARSNMCLGNNGEHFEHLND